MQKISPLRSSIEAFNKFKATRANKTQTAQNSASTNPFGIAFKGTVIQMDVFEKKSQSDETKPISPSLKEKLAQAGKLLSSARVATINKFSTLKANAIAFGNAIKQNSINAINKVKELGNKKVDFDFFKYNVSNLVNQPTGELEAMLSAELQGAI